MNKTDVKNFAIWARNKLISDITYQAGLLGVTEQGIATPLSQSTGEVQFFDIGTKDYAAVRGQRIVQRNALVSAIRAKERDVGFAAAFRFVVEKVAYTWFNRLIAIRFMEVNDYLPSRVRVLSSENPDKAEPDMVTRPFDTDLPFTAEDEAYILECKERSRLDELFRWLFIRQCQQLHAVLPLLFEAGRGSADGKDSYMELLLTISFTDKDGVLWHLVHDIKERDFRIRTEEDLERQKIENIPDEEMPAGQVEIIGWLYQYYNTEPKNQVFADLKKNIKISKDKIPAATQLFTPDWIVRYMVENSLGRRFIESEARRAESEVERQQAEKALAERMGWRYYLPEAPQTTEVRQQLDALPPAPFDLPSLRCMDPCMGSGHILVYLFDVLMQIYENQGWSRREAAQSIVENNLWGLDIDERAAQLAYFAVMMKARQYDRRFLGRGIQPHVYEIQESNGITADLVEFFANGDANLKQDIQNLLHDLRDAEEYGSILKVTAVDFSALYARFGEIEDDIHIQRQHALHDLLPLVQRAEAMAQQYDVVVTNPPYMGASGMNGRLGEYVKKHFPDSKSDLFAVFMERCRMFTAPGCYQAMITQHAWMFLSSYEKLRRKLLGVETVNMAHLGARAFEEIGGEVVQTTSFVFQNAQIPGYQGTYCRLIEPTTQQGKEDLFLSGECRFVAKQDNFGKIPGMPVAYWISNELFAALCGKNAGDYANFCKGMDTGDNNKFMRFWFEIANDKMQYPQKWVPYIKGGSFRKWYGNQEYVVNWENDGYEIIHFSGSNIRNKNTFLSPGIAWSALSSYSFACRYCFGQAIYDSKGCMAFSNNRDLDYYLMGAMNSNSFSLFMSIISPTLNFTPGPVSRGPIVICDIQYNKITSIVDTNIVLSRTDWDSFETSWDFQRHPLLNYGISVASGLGSMENDVYPVTHITHDTQNGRNRLIETGKPINITIQSAYEAWEQECETRFQTLKANEEALNRIFIDLYGLQDELTPDVADKDVTVRRADLGRDIRSLISYAVGCMFGRYSLDVDGLAYAGGDWDSGKYKTFLPDPDNCIPITDEGYFEDDIVGRFEAFLRAAFGENTLEANLSFVAKALGGRGGSSREVIRNYFLKDFFKDHCKIYQKRPIYWLFDSGKQNGFKALVYMHRWNADTVGNLRVEYLHRLQRVYEREMERMQDIIDNSKQSREVAQATKRREKLVKQLKEAREYDARIAHAALSRVEIDLDDGVKVNYEKVQKGPDGKSLGILAKI